MFLQYILAILTIIGVHALNQHTRQQQQQSRPVIGILSQPFYNNNDKHYIAASYVKWLESAGAAAIALPYDAPDDLVNEIFSQINGFLFPGGSAALPSAARTLWKLAIESNQRGEYFPVFGICLGLEFMTMLASNNEEMIHSGFNAENISLPLFLPTKQDEAESKGIYSQRSRLYPPSSKIRYSVSSLNITMNNHHKGIEPSLFMRNKNLTSMFHITSTNEDLDGRPFVSTIESFDFPFFATQYHPEKNNFEYSVEKDTALPYEAINHSDDAVLLSIHLSLSFVRHVRKNITGRYTKPQRHPMIFLYEIIHADGNFEHIYIIPPAKHWISQDTESITTST